MSNCYFSAYGRYVCAPSREGFTTTEVVEAKPDVTFTLSANGKQVGTPIKVTAPYKSSRKQSVVTQIDNIKGWGTVQMDVKCPVCSANDGEDVVWSKTFPTKPVPGGAAGEQDSIPNGKPIYICRAPIANAGIHVGKTWEGSGACNIGWGGTEKVVRDNVEYLGYAS